MTKKKKAFNLLTSIFLISAIITCMEPNEQEKQEIECPVKNQKPKSTFEQFADLPKDMRYEVCKQMLFSLIKENRPVEDTIAQIVKWSGINKSFKEFFAQLYNNAKYIYTDTLLETAVEKNWEKLFYLIIESNIDFIQDELDKALAWAVINQNYKIINELKELGASLSKLEKFEINSISEKLSQLAPNEKQNLFFKTVKKQNVFVLKYLLKFEANNIDIDQYYYFYGYERTALGNMALSPKFSEKSEAITKLLLAHGANVNAKDVTESTPFAHAAASGVENRVKLLLKYGADPKITTKYGTALMSLVNNCTQHYSLYNYYKADIDDPDVEKVIKMANLLIDSGVPLNTQDIYGDTALIMATDLGLQVLVQLLLDSGARTDIRNKEGKTAYDVAIENGYSDIASWIMFYSFL